MFFHQVRENSTVFEHRIVVHYQFTRRTLANVEFHCMGAHSSGEGKRFDGIGGGGF